MNKRGFNMFSGVRFKMSEIRRVVRECDEYKEQRRDDPKTIIIDHMNII